jgi:hypothetical protein
MGRNAPKTPPIPRWGFPPLHIILCVGVGGRVVEVALGLLVLVLATDALPAPVVPCEGDVVLEVPVMVEVVPVVEVPVSVSASFLERGTGG